MSTSVPPPTQAQQSPSGTGQGGSFGPGQQGAPPPGQAAAPPTAGATGGLPQTGLQQQLASLSQFYQQAGAAGGNIGAGQPQAQGLPGGGGGTQSTMPPGQMNIQQLAKNLASRYGLPMGRGELVDPQGNFLMTPDQVAAASGGRLTQGQAAASMNFISSAVANEQNKQQQRQGISALQTGVGLVQSRARGSVAALTSGFYQDIADAYMNQDYEAADFSFFIEDERFQIEQEMRKKQEKEEKKGALGKMIGSALGAGVGLFFGGGAGAGPGAAIGGGLGEAVGSWF